MIYFIFDHFNWQFTSMLNIKHINLVEKGSAHKYMKQLCQYCILTFQNKKLFQNTNLA